MVKKGESMSHDSEYSVSSTLDFVREVKKNQTTDVDKKEENKSKDNKIYCPYCKQELIKTQAKGYVHKNKQQTSCNIKNFKTKYHIEQAEREIKEKQNGGQAENKDTGKPTNKRSFLDNIDFATMNNSPGSEEEISKSETVEEKKTVRAKREEKKKKEDSFPEKEPVIEVMNKGELLSIYSQEEIEEMRRIIRGENKKISPKQETKQEVEEAPKQEPKEEPLKQVNSEKNEPVTEEPDVQNKKFSKMPRAAMNTEKISKRKGFRKTITVNQPTRGDYPIEAKPTESKPIEVKRDTEYVEKPQEFNITEEVSSEVEVKGSEGKTRLLNDNRQAYVIKRPYLVQLSTGEVIEIKKAYFIVGKGVNADFIVDNEFISRTHIAIISKNDKYYLKDLSSSNGTSLNEFRIPPETEIEIKEGDGLILANEKFEFHLE